MSDQLLKYRVADVLCAAERPLTILQIAKATGLARYDARRGVTEAIRLGWIEFAGYRKSRFGSRALLRRPR